MTNKRPSFTDQEALDFHAKPTPGKISMMPTKPMQIMLGTLIQEIRTTDGRTLSRQVDEPLGSATNQLSDDRLQEKFLGLASPVLGQDAANGVRDLVWALDGADSVYPLIERLRVGD